MQTVLVLRTSWKRTVQVASSLAYAPETYGGSSSVSQLDNLAHGQSFQSATPLEELPGELLR